MIEPEEAAVALLLRCPVTAAYEGRTTLLGRIPSSLRDGMDRSATNRATDLSGIVRQLSDLGRLKGGVWPVLIILDAAVATVRGSELEGELQTLIRELEAAYGREDRSPPARTATRPPSEPELLLFGSDRRVSFEFIDGAQRVSRAVARLHVPSAKGIAFGTAWLIAPELMITNWHVVDGFTHATADELEARCREALLWFDYHQEGGSFAAVNGTELVHYNRELDYALLRPNSEIPGGRDPVPLRRSGALDRGARVNIAQHPRGGPMRFAIRSNFLVETSSDAIRYVTDTEQGASGAPVCDDSWHAVALHARSTPVSERSVPGGVVRHLNEGIPLPAILADPSLPVGLV